MCANTAERIIGEEMILNNKRGNDEQIDGYIDKICVHGKTYKLRCEVVEVYAMTCPKCGGQLELKYGTGTCPFCKTNFTTQFKVVENG